MEPIIDDYDAPVYLICSQDTVPQCLHYNFPDVIPLMVSRDCQNFWESAGEVWLEFMENVAIATRPGSLFLFAAGPLSSVAVPNLRQVAPDNTYVDIGSAFELLLKGQSNRSFHHQGSREFDQLVHLEVDCDLNHRTEPQPTAATVG